MKKILITAAVLIITAGAVLSAQQAGEGTAADGGPVISDETDIVFDTAEEQPQEAEPAGFFTTWDFIKIILILAAVILIIYAVFFALKKAGAPRFQDEELIRVAGSLSLTQNSSLHIVEAAGKYYLIGCGDGSVTHIADIEDKETIDGLNLKRPQTESHGGSFSDFFSSMFPGKQGNKADLGGKITRNNKFMQDRIERLKKM